MFTVDLHSHILPGMDDGAKDEEVSLRLLQRERELGIKHIVLSSHFNFNDEPVSEFLKRRTAAFSNLRKAMDERKITDWFDLRPAAEISVIRYRSIL